MKIEEQLSNFITDHLQKIKPLARRVKLAFWRAAISGDAEDYSEYGKLELELRRIYSNPGDFERLTTYKKSGEVRKNVLKRQLDILCNSYLENQIPFELLEKIVALSTEIERKFSVFRGTIRGRKVTDNEIKEILKRSKNSIEREEAWSAGKAVGREVADDLITLVELRNRGARELGFDNYFRLSMSVGEQDAVELDTIFEDLFQLTKEPFGRVKEKIDNSLAVVYGVEILKLKPWHYHDPFFQEAPLLEEMDWDGYYRDKDIKEIAVSFFDSLGLPVKAILKKSDLYEREGKNPHAFCDDIDRQGDVRIFCNLKNNEKWMGTLLHELGHAVYDFHIDKELPYLLREPAHIFTTEAVAMFFGRLSSNALWMQRILGLSEEERAEIERESFEYSRMAQLIFVRWAMVMYDFEKRLYTDPCQDLNSLWWRLVGKYQLLSKPEPGANPDWAAKIHFSAAPCYYHNYLLGELLASQFYSYISQNILPGSDRDGENLVGCKEVGEFFREKVFKAGMYYHWRRMIERATGQSLTAEYFVSQFVVNKS